MSSWKQVLVFTAVNTYVMRGFETILSDCDIYEKEALVLFQF